MRTLLVVDDNQSVRESLRFLLSRRGYNVVVAEDGPEAVRLAAEHVIDGAMVDVNMPGMNGITVCRTLHEHAATAGRRIAVWLMSGVRTTNVLAQGREAGALDLLCKPFDVASLFRQFDQAFAALPPERNEDLRGDCVS